MAVSHRLIPRELNVRSQDLFLEGTFFPLIGCNLNFGTNAVYNLQKKQSFEAAHCHSKKKPQNSVVFMAPFGPGLASKGNMPSRKPISNMDLMLKARLVSVQG